jgi:hypothetical protein
MRNLVRRQYVRYDYPAPGPGVYQATPPEPRPAPLGPSAPFVRPFGGVGTSKKWKTPPPGSTKPGYEKCLIQVKEKGARKGSTRMEWETEVSSRTKATYSCNPSLLRLRLDSQTAYLFAESAATALNRFAGSIIGDKYKDHIHTSAKYYGMINYALANAGFIAYLTKYSVSQGKHHFRRVGPLTSWPFPVRSLASHHSTPLQPKLSCQRPEDLRSDVGIPADHARPSGLHFRSRDILRCRHCSLGTVRPPTHARLYPPKTASLPNDNRYFGNDELDPPVTITSNVTIDDVGLISRTYRSIDKVARDAGDSRLYGGVHFIFASNEGYLAG